MAKHFAPGWKDRDGNIFVFTHKNMIFKDKDAALQKSNSMFLSMLLCDLTNGGIIEFEMNKAGDIALQGIEADFGRVGSGYLISGPAFDEKLKGETP